MTGVFIADEMGLGKTVQALALIAATKHYPAVIVCPASLRLNWKRETEKWIPGVTAEVLYGTRPHPTFGDVLVIGYDVLHTWTDHLTPRCVVIDEAHYTKSGQARRTQATLRLADKCRDNDGIVVALTGTPILNTASELVAQLRIIGRLDEFGGASQFKRDFADPDKLPSLNRRLRATCYVRRLKAEVLKELPPKRWAEVVVEGDTAAMREYKTAEANIVTYLAQRARQLAEESGATSDEAREVAWKAALKAEAAQHLVQINALKRIAVKAKMPAARQWIGDFLDTGKKLVVFGWHRDVVDSVSEQFADGCKIQGGMEAQERQDSVDRFQDDEGQRVISCSIRAAGVGLTLTAASDVLFIEQGWNPADMDQASDRCHRIGQVDSVTAWNLMCLDTIDEDIAELIARKRVTVNAATDGVRSDQEEDTAILGDLLVRLASRARV
jgi:SNF2 family DNA or RNA helicase